MKIYFRVPAVAFLIVSLLGCAEIECNNYSYLLEHGELREELIIWANGSIFDLQLESKQVDSGGLVGPGVWRIFDARILRLVPDRASSGVWFSGNRPLEVRLLGDNPFSPEAVFLGRKAYQGIIISKSKFADTMVRLNFRVDRDVRAVSENIGILCYRE